MANSNITKRALAQSLKNLGAKKLFDKITVADITDDCGVNRQTFYYHFNDKYELLAWIYRQEMLNPLAEDLSYERWPEKTLELLEYMKSERKFITNTIKSSNNYFADYLEKVLVDVFEKAIAELDVYGSVNEHTRGVYARFFSYGITGVIVDWAKEGMKEDAKELSERMEAIVSTSERMGHELYLLHHKKDEQ